MLFVIFVLTGDETGINEAKCCTGVAVPSSKPIYDLDFPNFEIYFILPASKKSTYPTGPELAKTFHGLTEKQGDGILM